MTLGFYIYSRGTGNQRNRKRLSLDWRCAAPSAPADKLLLSLILVLKIINVTVASGESAAVSVGREDSAQTNNVNFNLGEDVPGEGGPLRKLDVPVERWKEPVDGADRPVGRLAKKLEVKDWNPFQNETIFYGLHKRRRRRRKRYVRFPHVEGGRFAGKHRPYHSYASGFGGGHHGNYGPWSAGPKPGGLFHVPAMRPRSPRLVFRDPVEPGTLSAPSNFFGNGLQDIGFDDDRGFSHRGAKGKYPSNGDQSLCANGKCEFFLSCWMSSGLIDGSCGGFLYACCQRPDKEAPKTNEHHNNDVLTLPTNFGPVVNDFRCGVSIGKLGAQRRIVGGDEAGFGSFPWQAYIRIGSSRCGGSLVNRYHVVTAGHCVARASARQVQVTLGDYVINSAVEPLPAYTFGVREIRVHPYFKFTPQADRFDVAVLRLDRPVQYMPHIAPICLPEKNEDFLGQFGWAAGWGALQAGSRLRPKTLQAVDVPVIDNRLCERWHKSNGINVVIYDEMMCAGYRNGGKDSCQGDSGGPLMIEKSNGKWYLIGIVSAGYSCAQRGQPGIYHRVAHTVDWISYVINS
ncbi:UNVERIFIED_CONTAM: hypothetical protein PYX00_010562 [Menopon gallinae]|uniref:Peptidase S1 domain-containing protein n=1 Tax=Menopon gallinae TaxID=328185 RepID=A0AAW2HG38_9NEOP